MTSSYAPEAFVEALRPGVMGPRLASVVAGAPPACHVLDAKYEPGVRAVVLYEQGGQLLRGDLLAAGDGPGPETTPSAGIVAPGLRVHAFPDDPELPSLPLVMDAGLLSSALAAATDASCGSTAGRLARRCRVELLRYRPGKRATVRLTFTGAAPVLIGKVYHNAAKPAVVAREAAALTAVTPPFEVLRLAPTVAHLPELSLVVQRAAYGLPLDALVDGRGSGTRAHEAVQLAARALVELHRAPPVSSRPRPVEAELRRFGVRSARVGTVDPELGRELGQLTTRLERLHGTLPAGLVGLVHGDCKPSQFLMQDGHAYLLDLDHCGIADQADDVGTFRATLDQVAARQQLAHGARAPATDLGVLADAFLETYLADRGFGDPFQARARWQQGVALERKALRAFARAPRSPLPGALVAVAHRHLDALEEA